MNFLFVFSDQQQRHATGCLSGGEVRTPTLDRLGREGVLARRAYANNPVCTPCRIGMFSGLHSSRTDTHSNADRIPPGLPTLADRLNRGGYRTSYVGKWHIGGAGNGPIPPELRGGFTDFIGYQCYNGFREGVCFYDERGRERCYDAHRTDVTTDIALERLRGLARCGAPFALFVSYQAPHYPVQPSCAYEAMYAGAEIRGRPNRAEVDPYTPTYSPPSPRPREDDPDYRRYGGDLHEYIRLYRAMVTQVDANVARLMGALETLGLSAETAVFYTSDHGDMQGSHGLRNKCLPYEESAGIPLVARVPGGARGLVCDAPLSSLDFYPTLLDLAGLPVPGGLDGRSFAPLLRQGSECDASRPVFAERPKWCMIVRDGWKLVADRTDDGLEPAMLFNLDTDPYEMRNLLDGPDCGDRRNRLWADLVAWDRDVTSDRLPWG
ncbi:MAG: sulfatase-like hydrolase/transferase [Planctomycetota bacterium]